MITISISYSIHQMIKNELDIKRRKAMDEAEAKKADLYQRFPRLREIEDEIHSAGFRYNKAILMGTVAAGSAVDELSDTIEELRKEREHILSSNGYPADYLKPEFECSKCSDTGIISSSSGEGDTLCICYRQLLLDHLYNNSNLCISGNEGFASFNTDLYPDEPDEKRYGIKNLHADRSSVYWRTAGNSQRISAIPKSRTCCSAARQGQARLSWPDA